MNESSPHCNKLWNDCYERNRRAKRKHFICHFWSDSYLKFAIKHSWQRWINKVVIYFPIIHVLLYGWPNSIAFSMFYLGFISPYQKSFIVTRDSKKFFLGKMNWFVHIRICHLCQFSLDNYNTMFECYD